MLIEEIKNIKSTKKDLRNFGLAVGAVLLIIGGLLFWKERPSHPYFLGLSAFLIASGLIFPSLLKPFQKAWMTLAVILGWVMTRVILSILFYLVVTPIGVVARLAGTRFLELKWDKEAKSYWNLREEKETDPKSYEKQF
jgi:hypothetical protein